MAENVDIKQFYKNLYTEMSGLLKPYGFRKKGDRFRRILDNGIAWEIEIQRNEFKIAKMYSFTVNVYIGLISDTKACDFWNIEISHLVVIWAGKTMNCGTIKNGITCLLW